MFFLADMYEALGTPDEEYLIVPSFSDTRPTDVTRRPDAAVAGPCLLVGPTARDLAADLGVASADWQRAISDELQELERTVLVERDEDGYWQALARFGPRMRSAFLTDNRRHSLRRPSFADLCVHVDDPHRADRLQTWLAEWSTSGHSACR